MPRRAGRLRAVTLALVVASVTAQSTASVDARPGLSKAALAGIGGALGAILLVGGIGGACAAQTAHDTEARSYLRRKKMRAMLGDVRGRV